MASSAASAAYLPRYQELARTLNINIVPGTICEVHGHATTAAVPAETATTAASQAPDFELRNMAYFISAGTGDIAGSYQKKNLWHPERPHLTSSLLEPHRAFDTPLVKADGSRVRAGMLVCWDLAFPEAFRELVADGADMVVIPSYWHLTDVDPRGLALNPESERVFLQSVTVARAFENTCAIVFCNTGGCSQVAMPIQGALGEIAAGEETMSVVDVDFGVLRIAEENYKVREDMMREGWHYTHTMRKRHAAG